MMWLLLALLILVALFAIVFFFLFSFPSMRRKYFTVYLLRWIENKLPKLSLAEREMLSLASQGWERQLFSGNPDWSQLIADSSCVLNAKKDQNISSLLSPSEQAFLNHQVETLCQLLDQEKFDDCAPDLPPTVWRYLKEHRFFALTIPEEYGGYGFSATAHSAIITKLASRSYSVAISVMVPNSVGPSELIQFFGSTEQKNTYLPRLARSEEIPCFALTSEEAGSDASSIEDKGVVCYGDYQGQTVLGIRLNWYKRYITLAPIATLIALAFKLYDPQKLLGDQENLGITLALIPATCPGVSLGKRHHPMHLAFMNGPIEGKEVFIPIDWVVGGPEGVGQGWYMILSRFIIGRGISLPALTSSSAAVCLAGTSAYSVVRQQFHHSIGEFEGVQLKLALIAGLTYLCQSAQSMLVQEIEQEKGLAVASAIAKYHLTEWNRIIVNTAMDIHGGRGIQTGYRNYLCSLYMSAPINITVEGSNILTRNLIIFGQSVVANHPFLSRELNALENSDKFQRLQDFDQVIWSHIHSFFSLGIRVFAHSLTGGRFIRMRNILGSRYWQQQMTRMSAAFLLVVDVTLLVVNKKLKRSEILSARLGDILSYLYLASAAIKFYQPHSDDVQESQLIDWCVRYCLAKINTAFIDLLDNYPKKNIGKLLKKLLFFLKEKPYQLPSDSHNLAIAKIFLEKSPLRQRMIDSCYRGQGSALQKVETAMEIFLRAFPILTKLSAKFTNIHPSDFLGKNKEELLNQALAKKILNFEEEKVLQEMYYFVREAIKVDTF